MKSATVFAMVPPSIACSSPTSHANGRASVVRPKTGCRQIPPALLRICTADRPPVAIVARPTLSVSRSGGGEASPHVRSGRARDPQRPDGGRAAGAVSQRRTAIRVDASGKVEDLSVTVCVVSTDEPELDGTLLDGAAQPRDGLLQPDLSQPGLGVTPTAMRWLATRPRDDRLLSPRRREPLDARGLSA